MNPNETTFSNEGTSSTVRKMGRPKSEDPKVSVTLTIHRSTRDRIATRLPEGQTVAGVLSAAVEHKYGVSLEDQFEDLKRQAAETDVKVEKALRHSEQVISRLKAR